MIVIIDYGMGNLGSVQNMVKKVGGRAKISSDKDDILNASKLILPGVGRFDAGMQQLKDRSLIEVLKYKVMEQKTPVLGICLGMQLMTSRSEEGEVDGLGWIDAEVTRFDLENKKVPHMGWNLISQNKPSKLFEDNKEEKRFYFVHSYFVSCANEEDVLCKTSYGIDFTSAFESKNIVGVQFHPEKSHRFGMDLVKKFLEVF